MQSIALLLIDKAYFSIQHSYINFPMLGLELYGLL